MAQAKGGIIPDGTWNARIVVHGIGFNRDIDNCIKPLMDLLVNTRVVPDDRYLHKVEIQRGAPSKAPGADIVVTANKGS